MRKKIESEEFGERGVFDYSKRQKKSLTGKSESVRFVPLGGLEEVGRNMMFFEYQDEIVIIDAGLQFPEDETPGIDFIIPNVSYLEENKERVKALIITHAHLDHIGAIPYIIHKIGNPTIYATNLSKELIIKRQEEFPAKVKLNFQIVKEGDSFKISDNFEAKFFGVPHTVPDSVAVILKTPIGNMCNLGDFRVNYDKKGNPIGLDNFERVAKESIHSLFMDSTNAERPGKTVSDEIVEQNLEKIFKEAQGRIIVGTFASLLDRIYKVIQIADRLGRKVAVSGRSMQENIRIAQGLGYIKTRKGVLIGLDEIHKYRDDKLLILSTGAQGEPNASLMKIINGEHRQIRIKPGDMVIFSSSIIPGNERSVQTLKDNLARQGAIIHHSMLMDLHASGHGFQEDIKTVVRILKPKYFFPIHGYYFMRYSNINNAIEAGVRKENCIIMDNGQVAEIQKTKLGILSETVPAYYVMVDGLGVGDVGEVVLRDRKMLSQEGMLVIITTLDKQSGRILKNPDIISRGFIYLKENKEILDEVRRRIRGMLGRMPVDQPVDSDYFRGMVRDQIGQFLFTKTKRRPMILPVIIEV
ncbi:MAG: ribonuclease J [Candidatus Pacebacteria bacterium]|nr:ribonuclease J [Candidatus Paceibacterota bacterium]